MTDFKWRHFQGDVILWAVRWYCRYPISYRDLEEMLAERGISVDHTTIYRWVQCYAPEMEKRLRWFWRRGFDPSWRLDETYVKVRGKWTYLYRAVDKRGDTIDFYLSPTRSAKAAKRFLGKALRGLKHWVPTAYATIKGFEVMRALRKGQARPWCLQPGIRGEVRLVERAFGIGPSALTEAMGMLNHHFAAAA
nr:IS6 family transposase [Escherichia coli]